MLLSLLACLGLGVAVVPRDCDADDDGAVLPACADSASEVDCDDADPAIHPGAFEVCDGLDNDCSGFADDPVDADGDFYWVCVDCDDADPAVFPGAEEVCDGVDNDCSGAADEPFDLDGDGYSPCGGDCDDADPLNAGGLVEVCDGQDNDCDGAVDEGFDADGDGWLTCRGDCDDTDPSAWYGAPEICDGVDQDCDGVADDVAGCWGCASVGSWLYCPAGADGDVAAALCEELGSGLVEIYDEATNAAVSAAVGAAGGGPAWIGLDDRAQEGTFVWSSGAAPTWTGWAPGQPDDADGEDCVALDPGAAGAWSDWDCDGNKGFVCAG